MKRWLCSSISILMLVASEAFGAFHLFQIEQLFSNADGTVQFVVMHEFTGSNFENLWGGNTLISTHAGVNKVFPFPNNLGIPNTAGRRVLIATQGFAALGIVTPDFVVPNGFLPTNGGTLNYAGVDSVTFPPVPTDGTTAITIIRNGGMMQIQMIQNLATNFAGQSASVTVGPPAPIIPIAGVYYNPNESGSGFGLDYQNGALVVEVYSYLAGGASQWYLAAGPIVNNVFTATLDKYTGGQCISCAYTAPAVSGNDGTITIALTSPTTATVDLPGGRHFQIQRFFPSLPVAGPSIPIGGVWWNPNESGSGLGLDYQNGTLLVEVYSYLAGGAAQWYLAAGSINNNVFTATLDKYTGGQCISCAYVAPALVGNDGQITITFTSPTTASADLPGGRHIQIQRFFQ